MMFKVVCKKEKYQTGIKSCNTHPHNFYVQLLAEIRIICFFLYAVRGVMLGIVLIGS